MTDRSLDPLSLRKKKILIMDDDEGIRMLAKEMLHELGHEAHFATNGNEAIELFQSTRNSKEPFDLLVLDLKVSKGMGGEETIRKLLEIDSSVKAIVSSGYLEDPITNSYESFGFKGVLLKPYEFNEMIQMLSNVFEKTDR